MQGLGDICCVFDQQMGTRWHIGISSASYTQTKAVRGSNPGKGEYLHKNINLVSLVLSFIYSQII